MQFVQQTSQELVDIAKGPGPLAEKQRQLEPLITRTVDVDGVGRFVLGRFWRSANAQQRQDYLQLFHHVMLNTIADKLAAYQGLRFTIDRAASSDDQVQVWTTVLRPSDPPYQAIWVIEAIGNTPKIVDVIAEGTSLRLTQRDDYTSFLARNNQNIDALIDALRRQVAQS
jgi:phospholipid transport system substrate-binding protein